VQWLGRTVDPEAIMAIGKDEVLEVLSDFRLRSIRFEVGAFSINVEEYNKVADFIQSEAIKVRSTKKDKRYIPARNTLFLIDGDSRFDYNIRTGILHECTHVIADINKARVTRLQDEAAAYLAQFTFMMLLDPNYSPLLLRGDPLHDLVRVGLGMVDKYKLGRPEGFGAMIVSSDIDDLARLVQRHPEYRDIKEDDQLDADGVGLNEKQAKAHELNQAARQEDRIRYEKWLLDTMTTAQTGAGQKKSFAYQQLSQHFFMVYEPVAVELLARFNAVRTGDRLSEAFYRFAANERTYLVSQLKIPKPPG
jgi:hypothetical protein